MISIFTLKKVANQWEVANFISQLNNQPEHQVGYCGTVVEEIEDTLLNDFSDLPFQDSFIAAYENDSLIGVVGLDVDKESENAEVWGPFVLHENWMEIAKMMWERLFNQLPISLQTIYGFYHVKNLYANRFMEELGATKEGEHTILTISSKKSHPHITYISEISKDYFEQLEALHKRIFPNAYYSAEEMVSKHNDEHKLLIAVQDGEFLGYIFCEANPSFSEGDIHFVAVSENARNRGIGRDLIEKGLQFLFSFEDIKEITLCVNSTNEAAISLYKKVGFEVQSRLNSYEIKNSFDSSSLT